ncbi:MAG: type IV secretory system conjugative DNA transfer family protein [Eubacterium sp.]|jgi:type IV secretion system protein VirD4|nr:type IV secretory system conjugative DNA transfer family protein [Eubacterium sp.]
MVLKNKNEKPERVMQIERFLSDTKVIIAILILEDLFFFFMGNFLFNSVVKLPEVARDLEHPGKYLGLKNILPDFGIIKEFHDLYIPLLITLLVILVVLNLYTAYKMKVAWSEEYFNVGQKGEERWTTDEEIKEQYDEIPDRNEPFQGYGGTIISRMGDKLYIDKSSVNNLVIGMTRSGKGEMFVISSIDVYSRAEKKASLIINDMKLELYKSSKRTLEKRGYKVYLLNFDDPLHSAGFNPLDMIVKLSLVGDFENAELLAQAFAFSIFNPDEPTNADRFWNDASTNLLVSLILAHLEDCLRMDEINNNRRYMAWKEKREAFDKLNDKGKETALKKYMEIKEKVRGDVILNPDIKYLPEDVEYVMMHDNVRKINMYSIINTFTELARIKPDKDDPDLTALDQYFNNRPTLNRAKLKYASIEISGNRTKSSIFAVMLSKLTTFTYENMARMTAESSFDLEEIGFGEKPVAVFLGLPDYDRSKNFMATVFIRQLNFILAKRANRERSGKCKRLVKFIIDEAGNMPPIENLTTLTTMNLGRDISMDFYVQALSQFEEIYGKSSSTIFGNCGNWIYIMTNDKDTAQEFSDKLGNKTIVDMQRSGEKLSTHKHFMENTQEKPLLNRNQLMRLLPGECVIKRVMKREDLQGNMVEPTSIFNSEKSGKRLIYRYEYLTDTFPNPSDVDLEEINKEDRSHIRLKERVWDHKISLLWIQQKVMDVSDNVTCIENLSNSEEVLKAAEKVIGKISNQTSLIELTDLIFKKVEKTEEREALLSMIRIGSEI